VFHRFPIAEAKRIMGLPESYILPEAQTWAGAMLGQGVHVGLFAQILQRVSGAVAGVVTTTAAAIAPGEPAPSIVLQPTRALTPQLAQADLFA
jgi:hypothetical protein